LKKLIKQLFNQKFAFWEKIAYNKTDKKILSSGSGELKSNSKPVV
jgi:hypothetical protein